MADTEVSHQPITDVTLLKLAREIAMEIYPLETVLKANSIELYTWEYIQQLPRFRAYLENEMAAWNGALNTHERVKLKSAALIEEWLPELYVRLHDRGESLNAKIEGGKLAARLAGMGLERANIGGGEGERFSVTINLGADNQLRFEKQIIPQVIDHEAL